MERLSIILFGILVLASPTEAQQPQTYPIPPQAKFIELDGQKVPVPERAKGMRVETRFSKPGDKRDANAKYRALPARATTFGGQKVPPGATHYRYVLKFTLPKKRGMSDVLNGDDAEGTYEVEGVVPGASTAKPPAPEPLAPTRHDPPATTPTPPGTPPATKPVTPARPSPAKPPAVKQVIVQIDY